MVYIPFCSYGATDTIYANYKYVMGDNDTKNDARKICFLEAKRRCIEKAGTYIESQTEITNYQLTKDEIILYAGAIIKVEVVDEKINFNGENIAVHMTVKADVDIDSIKRTLVLINTDKKAQNKIKKQQKQLAEMERSIKGVQKELSSANHDKSIELRKKRKETFDKIDEISKKKVVLRQKTTPAIDNIELGMTEEEVISLMGESRATSVYGSMKYRNLWIVFEDGVVNCIVKSKVFRAGNSCSVYRKYHDNDVIKYRK